MSNFFLAVSDHKPLTLTNRTGADINAFLALVDVNDHEALRAFMEEHPTDEDSPTGPAADIDTESSMPETSAMMLGDGGNAVGGGSEPVTSGPAVVPVAGNGGNGPAQDAAGIPAESPVQSSAPPEGVAQILEEDFVDIDMRAANRGHFEVQENLVEALEEPVDDWGAQIQDEYHAFPEGRSLVTHTFGSAVRASASPGVDGWGGGGIPVGRVIAGVLGTVTVGGIIAVVVIATSPDNDSNDSNGDNHGGKPLVATDELTPPATLEVAAIPPAQESVQASPEPSQPTSLFGHGWGAPSVVPDTPGCMLVGLPTRADGNPAVPGVDEMPAIREILQQWMLRVAPEGSAALEGFDVVDMGEGLGLCLMLQLNLRIDPSSGFNSALTANSQEMLSAALQHRVEATAVEAEVLALTGLHLPEVAL